MRDRVSVGESRSPFEGGRLNCLRPFKLNRLTQLVREHVDAAQLTKRGSCHLFRRTMATLMLENSADIRFIQAMLGHGSLKTT